MDRIATARSRTPTETQHMDGAALAAGPAAAPSRLSTGPSPMRDEPTPPPNETSPDVASRILREAAGAVANEFTAQMAGIRGTADGRAREGRGPAAREGIGAEVAWVAELVAGRLEAERGGAPPSARPGAGTALRLRILDRIRAHVVRLWPAAASGSGPADDPGAGGLLAVIRALEAAREALETDWHRRFGLALAEPWGLDLAAEVAHGLRSSCTSISFVAEALRSGMYGELDATQRHQMGVLYRAARTLSAAVEDISELAWSSAAPGGGEPEAFSPRQVVGWVEDLLRPVAEVRDQDLRVALPEPDPGARQGHPRALRKILLDLTLHALHLSEVDRVTLEVGGRGPAELSFAVRGRRGRGRDEGRAEGEEGLDALSRIFRTAADDEGYSFSQMGLAVYAARHLVATLGGDLTLTRPEPAEFVFEFALPLPPAAGIGTPPELPSG